MTDVPIEVVRPKPKVKKGKVSQGSKQHIIAKDTLFYNQNKLISNVFSTNSGKILLSQLKSQYIDNLSFNIDFIEKVGYDATIARGFAVDGQKQVVLSFIKSVDFIEKYPTLSGYLKRNDKPILNKET